MQKSSHVSLWLTLALAFAYGRLGGFGLALASAGACWSSTTRTATGA